MAAKIGTPPNPSRRRVFVLVDQDQAQGVFTSWDAAEKFAEKNRFSLERLMEYETLPSHPDHLHLMAAQWAGAWKFVGEWTQTPPPWNPPPSHIRLDHYHAKGDVFQFLRKKEFTWKEGILDKINPMAPDQALQFDDPSRWPAPPQWKPKLSPLKTLGMAHPAASPEKPPEEPADRHTGLPFGPLITEPEPPLDPIEPAQRQPLISEPEPPIEEPDPTGDRESRSQSGFPESIQAKPGPAPPKFRRFIPEEKPEEPPAKRKSRLRLRTKKPGLEPIPLFKPAPSDRTQESELSSVELAQKSLTRDVSQDQSELGSGKVRRIWPLRVILPIVSIFICWGGGIYWVFRPEPTAAEIVSTLASLRGARVITIEPGQVFFQLPVDPIQEQRWVRSLGLVPIPGNSSIAIPFHHTLETWEQPEGFVRPPYAAVEVEEWWKMRLRIIKYGFVYQWPNGSILVLDLESDMLIGWARAKQLPNLMN